MISWSFIFGVTFGVMVGTEIRRYRLAKKGETEALMPVWHERVLILTGCLAGALAIECARIALESPTRHHVWYLIFAAGSGLIIQGLHIGRELSLTRKELRRLQSETTDNAE